MSRVLNLDTIQNAADRYLADWSTGLESNKAGRVFRFVTSCMWKENHGCLTNAHLILAQKTISIKLGISRQWVGILADRLANAGWLMHGSMKMPDGMNSSSRWELGPKFKKLLIMLQKARDWLDWGPRVKSPTKPEDNNPLHLVLPLRVSKENSSSPPPQPRSDCASRTEDRRREQEEENRQWEKERELLLQPQVWSKNATLNTILERLRKGVVGNG